MSKVGLHACTHYGELVGFQNYAQYNTQFPHPRKNPALKFETLSGGLSFERSLSNLDLRGGGSKLGRCKERVCG